MAESDDSHVFVQCLKKTYLHSNVNILNTTELYALKWLRLYCMSGVFNHNLKNNVTLQVKKLM